MPHNRGRLQTNLYTTDGFNSACFVDFALAGNRWFGLTSGDDLIPDAEGLKNSLGLPTAMPAGGGSYWKQSQIWLYGEVGDWIHVTFDSNHTVILDDEGNLAIGSAETIAPGHLRYQITSKGASSYFSHLFALRITAMSGSTWIQKPKVYRAEHQSLIDAGEIWHPDLKTRLRGGSLINLGVNGVFDTIRFMDPMHSNLNWARTAADLRPEGYANFNGSMSDSTQYAGTASKTLNAYVTATRFPGNPASWIDGQPFSFFMPERPTNLVVEAVTPGNPTSFQVTGHGLSTNDEVAYENGSTAQSQWTNILNVASLVTGLPPTFPVTRIDANNFTLAFDSTGFPSPSSLRLMPVITVSDGTLPAKRCLATGITNHFSSAFSGYASGGVIHGRYNSEFDVVLLDGDRGGNVLQACTPVEHCVDLAADIGAHGHFICSPFLNQDGRRAWLQKIKDRMPVWMKPKLEIGNEPWNSSFRHNVYCAVLAMKYYGVNSARVGYGHQVMQLAADAEFIFDSPDDFEIVYNFQNVNNQAATTTILNSAEIFSGSTEFTGLRVGNRIDILASAPYSLVEFAGSGSAASYDSGSWLAAMQSYVAGDKATAFNYFRDEMLSGPGSSNQQLDTHINTFLPGHLAAIAGFTGRRGTLRLENYEGYQHVQGADAIDGGFPTGGVTVADIQAFWFEWLASEQAGEFMTRQLQKISALGVKPSIYTLEAPWGTGSAWGVLRTDTVYPFVETPAYLAMVRWGKGYTRLYGSA